MHAASPYRIAQLTGDAHLFGLRAQGNVVAGPDGPLLALRFVDARGAGCLLVERTRGGEVGEYYTYLPNPLRSPLLLASAGCGAPCAWHAAGDAALSAWATRTLPRGGATCAGGDSPQDPHRPLSWIAQLRPVGGRALLVARAATASHGPPTPLHAPPVPRVGGIAWFASMARALAEAIPPSASVADAPFLRSPELALLALPILDEREAPRPTRALEATPVPRTIRIAPEAPLAHTLASEERPKKR